MHMGYMMGTQHLCAIFHCLVSWAGNICLVAREEAKNINLFCPLVLACDVHIERLYRFHFFLKRIQLCYATYIICSCESKWAVDLLFRWWRRSNPRLRTMTTFPRRLPHHVRKRLSHVLALRIPEET